MASWISTVAHYTLPGGARDLLKALKGAVTSLIKPFRALKALKALWAILAGFGVLRAERGTQGPGSIRLHKAL